MLWYHIFYNTWLLWDWTIFLANLFFIKKFYYNNWFLSELISTHVTQIHESHKVTMYTHSRREAPFYRKHSVGDDNIIIIIVYLIKLFIFSRSCVIYIEVNYTQAITITLITTPCAQYIRSIHPSTSIYYYSSQRTVFFSFYVFAIYEKYIIYVSRLLCR